MSCCPLCGGAVKSVDFIFDAESGLFFSNGEVLSLPRREAQILEVLMAHAGRTLQKEWIAEQMYEDDAENLRLNLVESHMSKLRKKLSAFGITIKSERFKGYRLCLPPAIDREAA